MAFSNIIVAVDVQDPDNGRAAVRAAAGAAGDKGSLHLLYVRYFLPTRYTDLLASDFDEQEHNGAMETMRQWCEEAGVAEGRYTLATRRGRVRDEVLEIARQQAADLIVIGSHQPSLSSRFLGSNASAIVHQSPVSVLIVRH